MALGFLHDAGNGADGFGLFTQKRDGSTVSFGKLILCILYICTHHNRTFQVLLCHIHLLHCRKMRLLTQTHSVEDTYHGRNGDSRFFKAKRPSRALNTRRRSACRNLGAGKRLVHSTDRETTQLRRFSKLSGNVLMSSRKYIRKGIRWVTDTCGRLFVHLLTSS